LKAIRGSISGEESKERRSHSKSRSSSSHKARKSSSSQNDTPLRLSREEGVPMKRSILNPQNEQEVMEEIKKRMGSHIARSPLRGEDSEGNLRYTRRRIS